MRDLCSIHRLLPLSIGIILVVLFIIPMLRGSSLNIGSLTGFGCAGIFLLWGIFANPLRTVLAALSRNLPVRILIGLVSAGILLILVLVIAESTCMYRSAHRKPSGSATVVVLGCRVYGTTPSQSMIERLNATFTYLVEYENANCILSGGQGPDEGISEAECMYNYLVEKGIDPSRLYMEDQSTSTRENLLYSKEIMESHGFSSEVAIVTSEYHEYRSSKIAESLGLKPSAIPAGTVWWLFPTFYVRELYGILQMWLLG